MDTDDQDTEDAILFLDVIFLTPQMKKIPAIYFE
jgi:hypothetical protein